MWPYNFCCIQVWSSDVEQHLRCANQTYGTSGNKQGPSYKINKNKTKGELLVNVMWIRPELRWTEAFFSSKFVCIRESTKMPHTCFFPSSPLLPPFAPPPPPPPPSLPLQSLLKAITEIQFLIPPHRSSIDCKQIYIQAVNRKLQRFIYWVWRRETRQRVNPE